jgi:hypothetical protein
LREALKVSRSACRVDTERRIVYRGRRCSLSAACSADVQVRPMADLKACTTTVVENAVSSRATERNLS